MPKHANKTTLKSGELFKVIKNDFLNRVNFTIKNKLLKLAEWARLVGGLLW